jgi:hypothetical protein
MDTKKQAALEVILAALSVREEDTAGEFPDELHADMIDAALRSVTPKPENMDWLHFAEIICHGPLKRTCKCQQKRLSSSGF